MRPATVAACTAVMLALALVLVLAPGAATAAAGGVSQPRTLVDCPDCPELVVVPAGRFVMGSGDGEKGRPEGPVHPVRIPRPFALGRTEVTVAQFRRFVEQTGYTVAAGCRVQEAGIGATGRVEWRDDPAKGWRDPGFVAPLRDDHPVVCVGRIDALAYVEWLVRATGKPYRLPSETEWEYSARAGSTGLYDWGSNIDNGCPRANLYDRSARKHLDFGWSFADCDDGFRELAPVGRLQPNAFGLHDMIGNVWEWNADCYRETYATTPTDGRAEPAAPDCNLWSVRGGGWMTRPSRQRVSFRGRDPNDARYSYFGFRVARDLGRGER
jgi:formylglycine-generating enzyme required for sulfatase activity